MITTTKKIYLNRKGGRKRIVGAPVLAAVPQPCVPRIARLMALAIRFDKLIRNGVVADQTALAKLAHVTQPRMTQIMNLNNLAPDIQEALLFMSSFSRGRDQLHERMCRGVCAISDWQQQRQIWRKLAG